VKLTKIATTAIQTATTAVRVVVDSKGVTYATCPDSRATVVVTALLKALRSVTTVIRSTETVVQRIVRQSVRVIAAYSAEVACFAETVFVRAARLATTEIVFLATAVRSTVR
jgi:hypothetical protein